ncbi:MAG: response regulator [Desulfatirhabdiaceae bacterium]|nr:response regulator [Desulfatirhabdiaceae bacterium]
MPNLMSVFLIDDEMLFVESLTKVLRKREMAIKSAHSGVEALDILAAETFDVIVLDIKMPGMDGVTTLKVIRDMGITTPVIILSGHMDIECVSEVLKMGATELLLKPCDVETLVSTIENAHERMTTV